MGYHCQICITHKPKIEARKKYPCKSIADGRKQSETMTEKVAALPTLLIEVMHMSCIVDTMKKQGTVVMSLSGTILYTDSMWS
jgi:hypothetical protein